MKRKGQSGYTLPELIAVCTGIVLAFVLGGALLIFLIVHLGLWMAHNAR